MRAYYLDTPLSEKDLLEVEESLATQIEQVRAVYDYVATQIRYVAWEFGIHGYQPYNAATIFARRFGDCKDKSILMTTLLDRLGIEAHPVLVQAAALRGEQDLSTPLLTHFNHCIVFVPGLRSDGSFDQTDSDASVLGDVEREPIGMFCTRSYWAPAALRSVFKAWVRCFASSVIGGSRPSNGSTTCEVRRFCTIVCWLLSSPNCVKS